LNKIATQSKTDPKEWITNFTGNANDTGHESLEIKADEVEEYGSDVAITKRMAQKLADIDLALDKIEKKFSANAKIAAKIFPSKDWKLSQPRVFAPNAANRNQ
jgi:hypothetical protein